MMLKKLLYIQELLTEEFPDISHAENEHPVLSHWLYRNGSGARARCCWCPETAQKPSQVTSPTNDKPPWPELNVLLSVRPSLAVVQR
ncbi:hypothetical protein CRG98_044454 [Punica granatum]|uniref:Uncharacterized protein n=1 Tax=Punica granatum TaxID=22663 RepID=A0A2I0HTZ3_PUNGR|nr:hypothetical protein CRG98_044454 [Punica granatum]